MEGAGSRKGESACRSICLHYHWIIALTVVVLWIGYFSTGGQQQVEWPTPELYIAIQTPGPAPITAGELPLSGQRVHGHQRATHTQPIQHTGAL